MGRERRLRPEGNVTSGLGRPKPIRGSRVLGVPPSDPTAPYYGGAAVKAGSGSGEGRTRLTREGQKLDRRQVRNGDPTADQNGGFSAYRTPNVPERSGRGEQGPTLETLPSAAPEVRLERTAGTPKGS